MAWEYVTVNQLHSFISNYTEIRSCWKLSDTDSY